MLMGRLPFAAVFGYLVGSFPTGLLVTRLLGKPDPRFSGSGHTGGLNVYRLAGLAWGVFTMLVIARIVLAMERLKSDGTMRMENAVGQEGRVYLTIPEDGSGKVSIVIQGGLRELEAVSENKERIPTGETVRVLRVISNRILVVERVE